MIFFLFVIASAFFWFLTKLEYDYETEIDYPIEFSNIPRDKVLVGELPDELQLRLRAKGQTLMKYKFGGIILMKSLDMSKYPLKIDQDSRTFYVLSREFEDDVLKSFSSPVQIISIKPDTIFFDLANRVWKKVPVELVGDYNPAQQFLIKNIALTPDSITISGPNTLIDTIDFVQTEAVSFNDISEIIEDDVEIVRDRRLKYDEDEVNLKIEVEKYTEAVINIPIKTINVPDTVVLRTFPKTLKLTYFVSLSDFDKVFPHFFEIKADYSTINVGVDNKVKLSLEKYPEKVSNVRMSQESVDFIIELK